MGRKANKTQGTNQKEESEKKFFVDMNDVLAMLLLLLIMMRG